MACPPRLSTTRRSRTALLVTALLFIAIAGYSLYNYNSVSDSHLGLSDNEGPSKSKKNSHLPLTEPHEGNNVGRTDDGAKRERHSDRVKGRQNGGRNNKMADDDDGVDMGPAVDIEPCTECGRSSDNEVPTPKNTSWLREVTSGVLNSQSESGPEYPKSCYTYKYHTPRQLIPSDARTELGCNRNLPDAFIIGVKKGGTQSLTHFLDLHPAIIRNEWQLKWSTAICSTATGYNSDAVHETRLRMPFSTEGQVTIANYPGYFITHQSVLRKMRKRLMPKVKVIVILRRSAKRAVSDFTHIVTKLTVHGVAFNRTSPQRFRGDRVTGNFTDSVIDRDTGGVNTDSALIHRGHYSTHLISLYNAFDPRQVLVVDGERFSANPAEVLQQVEKFLRVPPFFDENSFVFEEQKGFFCANISSRPDLECMPKGKGRVHLEVDHNVLEKVKDHYRPYNSQLATLLRTKGYEPFPWLYE